MRVEVSAAQGTPLQLQSWREDCTIRAQEARRCTVKVIKDRRFVGFFDAPPQGMSNHGKAMGRKGFDVWTNGKSIFSPDMRWALVRTREVD